ncbi:hypothetical protein [Niastella populi]|uniref:Uncharacterized protein n=1 Tax=Niastella populi TaxID=550983 RepID=A0A1V9EP93_9BACT|nr:hypothetical protein [Niastella populi]OQP47950.1 hypothetical protein A4R26_31615 [Niastella populi]
MEQNKNDMELLQLVVKGMHDELATLNQKIQEQVATVNLLRSELSAFQEKQENKAPTITPADFKPYWQNLEKGIQKVEWLITEKLSRYKFNKLETFLQSDAKKWIVILLLGFTFLTYLYWYLIRS